MTAVARSAYLACVVHVPLLSMQEKAINHAMWDAYQARIDEFNEFDPELVVVFGGDHYDNIFLNLSPQFMIGHLATALDDCGGRPGRLDVPMDISKGCASYLVENGFDVATSYDMGVDHGFSNVIGNFMGEVDSRPVLPVFVNALAEPRPTLRRCRQIGHAVGEYVSTLGKRVAFLGSGGLSHNTDHIFPQYDNAATPAMRDYIVSGGSRGEITRDAFIQKVKDDMDVLSGSLVDGTHAVPWISQEWDHKFLDTFVSGELERFDSWTDAEIVQFGGGGANEVRQWIAAASAAQAAGVGKPVLDYYSSTTTLAVGVGVAHAV